MELITPVRTWFVGWYILTHSLTCVFIHSFPHPRMQSFTHALTAVWMQLLCSKCNKFKRQDGNTSRKLERVWEKQQRCNACYVCRVYCLCTVRLLHACRLPVGFLWDASMSNWSEWILVYCCVHVTAAGSTLNSVVQEVWDTVWSENGRICIVGDYGCSMGALECADCS